MMSRIRKASQRAVEDAIEKNFGGVWSAKLLFYRGQKYEEREDYEGAERCYKRSIAINPNHATPWNNLGNIYYYIQKNYQEAERC